MAKKKPETATAATAVAIAAEAEAPKAAEVAKTEAPKKEPKPKIEQNGVTRPGSGATAKVWEVADRLSKETGSPALREAVQKECEAAGVVLGTINTQYGKWRKFHGLSTVRQVSKKAETAEAPAAETAEPEAPEAPAAE